ncbi:MAG: ArnT family glycosyltransferase [Leptonema sp. (in: bacteria)]
MLTKLTRKEKFIYFILFSTILLIYLYTLPFDVMDIDSSQYAEITREMVENSEYFFIRDNGKKYLDKPILTFWIISIFYKVFGIHNFSFRISALTFAILSTIGIYQISFLIFENQRKSILSALLFLISPGLFSMVLNPLIDIYLIFFLIYTFYFYYLGILKNPNYFYFMYFFIVLGFITKGPISLVIPLFSIGGNLVLTRNWSILKKIKIFSGIMIILIPVFFWSYLLYKDFGIYGPYFFLYLQSFGRFFNKIYDVSLNPFYFYFTYFFYVLPFGIPFLFALKLKKDSLFEKKILPQNSLKNKIKFLYDSIYKKDISLYLWGFLVLFLLSFSRFQLPQYVFWVIPANCILAGHLIESYFTQIQNSKIRYLHFFVLLFALFSLLGIHFYGNFELSFFVFLIAIIAFILSIMYPNFLNFSYASFFVIYSYVVSVLYPFLISFQPSSKIATKILETKEFKQQYLYTLGIPLSYKSLPFYTKKITKDYFLKKEDFWTDLKKEKIMFVVSHQFFLETLQKELKERKDIQIEILGSFPSLKVSKPKIKYLNPNHREKYIEKIFLVKITKID